MLTAAHIIETLNLAPHPEGGWFRETFRDPHTVNGRAASTAIYYLLAAGQRSHWHRVDAVEAWHFHAGAPLTLGRIRSFFVHRRPSFPCGGTRSQRWPAFVSFTRIPRTSSSARSSSDRA